MCHQLCLFEKALTMSKPDDVEKPCFKILWTIENFSYYIPKSKEFLSSPVFTVDLLKKTAWELRLYPKGHASYPNKGKVIVLLHRRDPELNKESVDVAVDCEISFLTGQGVPKFTSISKYLVVSKDTGEMHDDYELRSRAFREPLSEAVRENTLRIQCRMWMDSDYFDPGFCLARTRIGAEEKSFIWTVEDFLKTRTSSMKVFSWAPLVQATEFNMAPDEVSKDDVEIFISQSKTIKPNSATCVISHLTSVGKVATIMKDRHFFAAKPKRQVWKFPKFLSMSKLLADKSNNNRLVLRCVYTLSFGVKSSEIEYHSLADSASLKKMPKSSAADECLKEDLKTLYEDKTMCDVNLRVGTDVFPVHKAIISARSPVFKAMLASDMQEKHGEYVDIPDLDAEAVEQMLRYVYTNSVKYLVTLKEALKLYFCADKYELLALRRYCGLSIQRYLSIENACEVLDFADVHNDRDLRDHVQHFMFVHDAEILRSGGWRRLVEEDAKLAVKTLTQMYKEKSGVRD